ncbi:NEDD4 family-interacting protein 1-like [Nematostella vectensis]|uniref:NEDD4 family-interacting protein 1-like n=1 Tax=Nematostella vectensis TaxID=45351 RepID=UPI002077937B|nr:NEDD4 family-interacting protein 1-like [Nematostella vectensis]
MSSNQRYVPVPTSDDTPASQHTEVTVISPSPQQEDVAEENSHDTITQSAYVELPPDLPPPPYTSVAVDGTTQDEMVEPPAYSIASKLPTYEEAEGVSQLNEDLEQRNALLIDGGEEVSLGTDWLFVMCFAMAFLFNWLGFFAAYCLTRTVASRYGAISGFGLSMVKWVLILKEAAKDQDQMLIYGQGWLWWIFFALGWLLFIRATLAYIHIKMLVRKGCRRFPRFWGLPVQQR